MKKLFVEQTVNKIGQEVELYGWVDSKRDHKKIVFIDLRDRTGIVQVVGGEEFKSLSCEDVIYIKGIVKKRPKNLINPKLRTGTIEVEIKEFKILAKSKPLPLPINSQGYEIDEEVRLKYRYLDLRRPRMLKNLILKSKVTSFIRNYLIKKDFIEIETPILTKTTPEGARDFIVPSRLQKGKFYALPQSPQQYKQLLMVAGVERYFQIARCFRDEDPRADRAYGEFTQLDLEMSFVTQEDILTLTENLFTNLVKQIFPEKYISQTPWPRLNHQEVIKKYGNDKPDLRKNKKDRDELAFAWIINFPLFKEQTEEDFYYGSGKAKFAPSHHMFTAPHPSDIPLLDKDPLKIRGLQHDMVLNGYEVGGGSIRIHDPKIQNKVFELIGFTKEQKNQFEHILNAFTYGVPPHGGIAPGIDRFLMAALGEPSIREIIAFPTSSGGKTAVMDAPSSVEEEQLKELGIEIEHVNPLTR
jgi:aspartyl-tRNA synthetase